MPRDDIDGETSINKIFLGEASSVQSYGAFVSIPGTSNQGLVHKSQISNAPVPDATEVVSKGDRVWCKIIGVNDEGKISLSMKVVNQGNGKDLDPNGVIIQQDENRRKSWNPQNRRQAIVLDAVFNTKCSKCGTSGHLSKDCFQVPGGRTYELLPEVEASESRNAATAEKIIENIDSKTQATIKKKLKKEKKKQKKQKKKARKLKKMKKKKSKSKKRRKHKASSDSSSSSSSSSASESSSSSESEEESDAKRRRNNRSAEKSAKGNPSAERSQAERAQRADLGSRNQDRQSDRRDDSRGPTQNRNQHRQRKGYESRTSFSSSPESRKSPKRRRRSPSPEAKRSRHN